MRAIGLEWIGTRTVAYTETVSFFRDLLGLPTGHLRSTFVRFDLPDGASIEVFKPGGEEDHPYFTTGPVVGIQVDDFDATRGDLGAAGIELVGVEGGAPGEYRWQHFRGPDGAVYEIVEDPGRVRLEQPIGPCRLTGFGWVGIRTARFDAMRRFVVDSLGLRIEEEGSDLVVCSFPRGDVIELFRTGGREDHPHLTTGPVPGLLVEDLDLAERQLREHRIEILARKRQGQTGWTHFRAPDRNVYEFKRSGTASLRG